METLYIRSHKNIIIIARIIITNIILCVAASANTDIKPMVQNTVWQLMYCWDKDWQFISGKRPSTKSAPDSIWASYRCLHTSHTFNRLATI